MRMYCLWAIVFLLFHSCKQNNDSNIEFKTESLSDRYSIEIPVNLNRESDGYWNNEHLNNNELFQLRITLDSIGDRNIDEILYDLVSYDKREVVQNKVIVRRESLKFDNFVGVFVEYEKNNNKGNVPIMTNFAFGVLQDGTEIIKFSALSFGKNYMDDVLTTVKSIERIADEKSNTLNAELTEKVRKIDISDAKKEGFQVFENDNFIVKCICKLSLNTELMDNVNKEGNNYPIRAFMCVEKPDNYEAGVIYNINITDLSIDYNNLETRNVKLYEEAFLKSYIENIERSRISYNTEKYLGFNAVEYSFNQNGLPTKAIVFVKNKKSFTLQVGTRKKLDSRFHDLKKSFNFISQ